MFVYLASVSQLTAMHNNSNLHYNMTEELKRELLDQINELLYLPQGSCDLWQAFDDLLLDYGYDGDPQELLFELM